MLLAKVSLITIISQVRGNVINIGRGDYNREITPFEEFEKWHFQPFFSAVFRCLETINYLSTWRTTYFTNCHVLTPSLFAGGGDAGNCGCPLPSISTPAVRSYMDSLHHYKYSLAYSFSVVLLVGFFPLQIQRDACLSAKDNRPSIR